MASGALVAQRLRQQGLAGAVFPVLVITDQRIRDVLESAEDGFPVSEHHFLALRLGSLVVADPTAHVKDRDIETGAAGPRASGAVEDAQKVAGLDAAAGGEADARVERGLGYADPGIGRDEVLFGLAQIGPAFEESGGQPRRHVRGLLLGGEGMAAFNGTGLFAKQIIDEIFGLFPGLFEQGQLRLGGGNQSLRLVYVEHAPDAALLAGRYQPERLLTGGDGFEDILELGVVFAEVEVRDGNLGDQCLHDALAVLVKREKVRAGGLGGAAHFAEQIRLPGRSVKSEMRPLDRGLDAVTCRSRLRANFREHGGPRGGDLALGPEHALGGDADVVIGRERVADEVPEDIVLEDVEPFRIAERDLPSAAARRRGMPEAR